MVKRYIVDWLEAVKFAPLTMRHGTVRPIEISLYILMIKRIVDGPFIHPLNTVIVIAEGDIHAGVTDVFGVKRMTDNMAIIKGLPDLSVAIDCHCYLSVHLILVESTALKQVQI